MIILLRSHPSLTSSLSLIHQHFRVAATGCPNLYSERIKAYLVELVNRMRSDASIASSPPSPRATPCWLEWLRLMPDSRQRFCESARHSTDSTGQAGASHRAVRKPVWSWLCGKCFSRLLYRRSEGPPPLRSFLGCGPQQLWPSAPWPCLRMLIFSDICFNSVILPLYLLMLVPTFGMLPATVTKVRGPGRHTNRLSQLFASIKARRI